MNLFQSILATALVGIIGCQDRESSSNLFDTKEQESSIIQDPNSGAAPPPQDSPLRGGIVNFTDGNGMDLWPRDMVSNLTYCIAKKRFSYDELPLREDTRPQGKPVDYTEKDLLEKYELLKIMMTSAANAWEQDTPVNFVHLADEDENCNQDNDNVVFKVYMVDLRQLGAAFYPSDRGTEKTFMSLKIGKIASQNIKIFQRTIKHELGHVLGLRHEHIKTDPETREREDNYQYLSVAVDFSSVMFYPTKAGYSGDENVSQSDLEVIRYLYE